jgi:alpha-1,4-digalacturonate transport system permease protein
VQRVTASAAIPARREARRAGARRKPGPRIAPYLFILPNLVAVGLFSLWPMISGVKQSFYKSVEGQAASFAGLQNYHALVTNSEFWSAVRNTLEFVVGFVACTLVLATALALLLNAQRWARGLFRAAVYVPVLISPIVVGILWNWLLQPNSGVIDAILAKMGLGQPGWLVDPNLAMFSVIFVQIWATIGFYSLIILGGLQSIDPNLFEAARVDGASEWRQIRKITLPSLQPTLLVVLILSTITGFQAFEFLWTLTGGGPVGATTLIIQYIYDHAFIPPINYGLATAASVLLFLVLLVLTLVNLILGRRRGAA